MQKKTNSHGKTQRPKVDGRTLKRIAQAFSPYKWQAILVGIAVLLTTLLGLISPLTIRTIFDVAIPQHNIKLLLMNILLLISIPIATGIIGVGQMYLSATIGQQVIRDFRNKLYVHMQSMPFRFFTSTGIGDIQSRLTNDVSGIQNVVTNSANQALSATSLILGTIVAMVYISPLLTLITFGLLPLFIWITEKVGSVSRRTQKNTQQGLASLSVLMQETLSVSGILLIKTFGRQQFARENFAQENQQLANLGVRLQMLVNWFNALVTLIFAVTPAIVYLVAGWQIIDGTHQGGITLGGIIAFTTLQARLLPAIGQMLNLQIQIQSSLALFDRIFEYMDLPIEIEDAPQALHLTTENVQGAITFRDVTFSYKRDKQEVRGAAVQEIHQDTTPTHLITSEEKQVARLTLDHASFHIKPGQLAAFVGPSGAGKTTMAYLILRLYDVECGAVEIDGYNVKDISLESLSNITGIVTQETYLLHTSVRENLLFARPDATEEMIIAAAQAAAIHKRIMELDDGYDTIVGERGYKLSGGEKQRIAIARILLKDPRILILDEATSSLDTYSERLIQSALEPLMKHRTCIAIAHRLSTILAANIIFVVDQGKIVEQGAHEELLQQNGLYTKLYNQQFRYLDLQNEIELTSTVEHP